MGLYLCTYLGHPLYRGFKVTDSAKLEAAGIDRAALADLVCDVFGKLLHVYGFIHCDPHPGNLLVRKQKHTGRSMTSFQPHSWLYRWGATGSPRSWYVSPLGALCSHFILRALESPVDTGHSVGEAGLQIPWN